MKLQSGIKNDQEPRHTKFGELIAWAVIYTSAILAVLWTTPVSIAATIERSADSICVLSLKGEIVEGDLARLQAAAQTYLKGIDGESSANDTICLDSPGGSVAEGVLIAEFVYSKGIGTIINEGAECYSMCAIIFMMGIAQGPEVNFVNRKLHVTGKLGFHRPYLALDSDDLVSARTLPIIHDQAIESISRIMILANNRVPWSNSTMMRPDLVQEMLKHIGNDFFSIDTIDKAGRFEIEMFGNPKLVPLTDEAAYYACENAFHWQVGLIGGDTDFQSYAVTMQSHGGRDYIVKRLADKEGRTVFSVVSGDAGYSEAGCLISDRKGYVEGCGYNGMYNVSIGQGECTLDNFDVRSVLIQPIAVNRPGLLLYAMSQASPAKPETSLVGVKIAAMCEVISSTGGFEKEPCIGSISHNVFIEGKRADRYEFVWPSGNKTIIAQDGDSFSINGKPAKMSADGADKLCALNMASGNRFCFSIVK
jgi:hypothetical protein